MRRRSASEDASLLKFGCTETSEVSELDFAGEVSSISHIVWVDGIFGSAWTTVHAISSKTSEV